MHNKSQNTKRGQSYFSLKKINLSPFHIKSKNIQPTNQTIDTLIAIYDFIFKGNPPARAIRGKEITFRGTFTYKE